MKRFKSIVIAGLVALITAAYALPAMPTSALDSASLSIAPRKDYVIQPGKSVDDTLVIRNLDPVEPLNLSMRVIDFTFTNDGGTPKLMLDPNAPQTTWSLKPFLTVPKTVSIAPGTSKSVDMSVAIPAGHGAGSYYSAILYSSGASNGGNVGLSASGVTLVFTQVPGKVKENLELKKFGAYVGTSSGEMSGYTSFMTTKPQMLAYTLKNHGNVVEAPVGSITLKDMWGHKTNIDDINPNKSLALIGQTRTFTSCIQRKDQDVNVGGSAAKSIVCETPSMWPGLYTATLDAFYGQNGNNTQEIVKTIHFVYMPIWAIVILIVILLIIAYYVWRITRAVRRFKNGGVKLNKSRRK